MAAKRGKSQARRNSANTGGLPGWAWLILGIIIALGAVLVAPRFLKPDGNDGFIRPRPNPDAQPAAANDDDAGLPTPSEGDGPKPVTAKAADEEDRQYDFYTLLPGQEVQMSDAELAASARAEEARQKATAKQGDGDAEPALPTPIAETTTTPATTSSTAPALPTAGNDNQAHYILQAGAFGASGDAEALKARIALLGLNARVESANIKGKTVFRVRMGPYGSATELAEAKGKLASGGLPAMAIKAQ